MNILFITPSYKPAYIYGGPVVVIARLAESLVKLGHSVTVYTTTANGKEELPVVLNQATTVDGVRVFYFARITKDHTHISVALWKQLRKYIRDFEVVHIHSWWNLLAMGAAYICMQKGVVPVLSPHGMFSRYILQTNNSGVKKILHNVIGRKLLSKTILHVSTSMELRESREIIPGWQGKVIPNLVSLSPSSFERKRNDVFTIGFLSRIDPKKGLDILLKAVSQVSFPYRLLVAGSGEETYIQSLHQLAKELEIEENIEWVGWKKGSEKFDYLAGLDLFALISHSENFAIVVIESLSVGTPVLISDQVGLLEYVSNHDFGWITTTDVATVTKTVTTIYNDKQKREAIQTKAPAVIADEFDDEKLTEEYIALYNEYRHIWN